FWSSSRRQTSSKRDWSSDVCSSDLLLGPGIFEALFDGVLELVLNLDQHLTRELDVLEGDRPVGEEHDPQRVPADGLAVVLRDFRSEERRVGKEWSCWRTPYLERQKI